MLRQVCKNNNIFLKFEISLLLKPYLEYCCSIWGSTSQENINTIVKLQKRAARLILDADFSTPSAILFQELKWISFSDIVKFHQLSFNI